MSEARLSKVSSGRDKGEMDELKKLILSEKARTKHHDGGGGGKDRGIDGGDVSDDDEGEGGARDRGGGRDGRGGRSGAGGAKEKKQKGTWRRGKLIMASGDDDRNKYRDRAEERRKGHNPDYADKLNQMASMDAETTKYLGGDVEHTHLVKGLDYALLVKIREEERQQQMEALEGAGGDDRNGDRGGSRAEVRARTLMGKTVLAVLRKLNLGHGAGGPDFRRVAYEFDLEPESVQEIPTAVAHSLGEDGEDEDEEDHERHTNYLMEESLLDRVESAFTLFRQHGGKARRQRKRARDKAGGAGTGAGNEEDAIVAALAKSGGGGGGDGDDAEDPGGVALPPARRAKVSSINIFEDTDDRYPAPGSAGSARSAPQPSAGAAAKGYFSGLRAANNGESGADKASATLPTRAEMSATVKAAARAAAARVSGAKGVPSAAKSGGGGGGGGRDKIERDIFAARPSRGQALGVSAGGYDVFPETGDFETYDSDEDATNKKDAKPGADGGGAAGGGGRRGGDKNQDGHPAFDKPKASFPYGVKKSEMSGRKGGGGGKRH
eukprot:g16766.t1